MPASTSITLNTGAVMPTLGFGTWRSAPGAVEKAVEVALKNGYTHIDTATGYGNEKEVGEGIKASGVPREKIFLTTKLNESSHHRVADALEDSLKWLDTPYLDLWLMHWPCPMRDGKPDRSRTYIDTWREMERLFKAHPDKLKAIGVSNFSVKYLTDLLKVAEVVPAINQIEGHPACMQQDLVDFCLTKGIALTSYSPLGSDGAPLIKDPVVLKIAEKYSVSPANVLVSLHANRPNTSVLAKSVTADRIIANNKVIDLTDEDVKELAAIEERLHFRACTPYWTGHGSIGFPDLHD